jgi:hypothetical protein
MDVTPGFAVLKEMVRVGFALEALIVDAASSSGISLWIDAKKAMDLLPEAKDAATHLKEAETALENMSTAEVADLIDYATTQLNLPPGKTADEVSKALKTAFKLYEIFVMWRPELLPVTQPMAPV